MLGHASPDNVLPLGQVLDPELCAVVEEVSAAATVRGAKASYHRHPRRQGCCSGTFKRGYWRPDPDPRNASVPGQVVDVPAKRLILARVSQQPARQGTQGPTHIEVDAGRESQHAEAADSDALLTGEANLQNVNAGLRGAIHTGCGLRQGLPVPPRPRAVWRHGLFRCPGALPEVASPLQRPRSIRLRRAHGWRPIAQAP